MYLAPEILQTNGHGIAVDWWALGVLLFMLLTLEVSIISFISNHSLINCEKPPFYSADFKDVFRQIKSKEPEWNAYNLSSTTKLFLKGVRICYKLHYHTKLNF